MEKNFWLERWDKEEIGFHQERINPHLQHFWHELPLACGNEVFVPLCGKSRDMRWLRQQGHSVLGVELSTIATQAFFTENGYNPLSSNSGKFMRCEADEIRILCGDFFDLTPEDMKKVSTVYDRASLIALPPEMRARYVSHLARILPPATHILLITLDYHQHEMSGPPFAVSVCDVETLFHEHAEIRQLQEIDVLAQNPHFQKRGLSRMHENVFLLTLR